MENPSYIALSHQTALRRQMDIIANNLANVSSPSYKAERSLFAELLAGQGTPGVAGGRGLSFVDEIGMLRDLSPGALTQTGNTLDIALHGRGYFVVETPAGTRYTRQGSLRLDEQGRLVTADGHPLLDEANRPIAVRPGESRIEISHKGIVTTESGEVGRIRVVGFDNEQALRKLGGGLYETDSDPQPPDPKTEVRQGMIESSNVRGVLEITNMIEVMRRYQSAQRIIESEHELQRRAIDKLARVG